MSSEFYFDQENFFTSSPNLCKHSTTDLISIRNCSIWFLNIIWKYNKYSENNIIYGKNESVNITSKYCNNTNLLNQNIQNALPIDFSLAQQFVYEKNIEKIKFSIMFDIEDYDCPIKYLCKEYSNYNFEIYINSNIHNIPMLKENINFIVKGYDILKTIQNKLVEIKSQKLCKNNSFNENKNECDLVVNNENNELNISNKNCHKIDWISNTSLFNQKTVYAKIFSNMNFSFAIEFSMENFLLDNSSINFTNIAHSNIRINKIFIEYFVPLCILLPRIPDKLLMYKDYINFPQQNNMFYNKHNNQFATINNSNQQIINTQGVFNNANYHRDNQSLSNENYYDNFHKYDRQNQNMYCVMNGFTNNGYDNNYFNSRNKQLNSFSNKFQNNQNIEMINSNRYQANSNNINENHKGFIANEIDNSLNNNNDNYFNYYKKNFFDNQINYKNQAFIENSKIDENGHAQRIIGNNINSENVECCSAKPSNDNILEKINKNKPNSDFYALKLEKMVDFIPKNFKHSKIESNNNHIYKANCFAAGKDSNQSNKDNLSNNSSMISLGTTPSLISSLEEEENTQNSHSKINKPKQSHLNSNNSFTTYDDCRNNFNPEYFTNLNNQNLELNYFSNNIQNDCHNFHYPIIISPKACNININLNPQIYGNILLGNSKDLKDYFMHKKDCDNEASFDDNFSLNKKNSEYKSNNHFDDSYKPNTNPTEINDKIPYEKKPSNQTYSSTNNNQANFNFIENNPKKLHKTNNLIENNNDNNNVNNQNNVINKPNNNNFNKDILTYSSDVTEVFLTEIKQNNFCNFYSFITCTSPLMLRSEETSLKNLFRNFEKQSLFGADCLFKFNNKIFNKSFYPSLSAINIELNTCNKTDSINNISNLNSTLDGSFFSHISECEAYSPKLKSSAFYYEDSPMHLRPLLSDKAYEFLKSNELENCLITDVAENSWFSILWTPEKQKNNCHSEANASFVVFYKIRPESFDCKIGFLPVIGVFDCGKINNEIFWFSNQATDQSISNKNNLQNIKDDYHKNQNSYLQLMENIEKFVGKNKFSEIYDLIVLSKC